MAGCRGWPHLDPDERDQTRRTHPRAACDGVCRREPSSDRYGSPSPRSWRRSDIDEATGIIGHTWEPTDSARVVTHVLFDDPDPNALLGGVAFGNKCTKGVLVVRDALSLAHELGHTYGLDHVCDMPNCADTTACFGLRECTDADEGNLMHPYRFFVGPELTSEQQETIDASVERQRRCRKRTRC